jgi:hypothetical protein
MSAFWRNFASNNKKDYRQGPRLHTDGISFAFFSLYLSLASPCTSRNRSLAFGEMQCVEKVGL